MRDIMTAKNEKKFEISEMSSFGPIFQWTIVGHLEPIFFTKTSKKVHPNTLHFTIYTLLQLVTLHT